MRRFFGLALLGALGASAQAVIYGFAVPIMHGGQEVPPTNSFAYGSGSFTLDDQTWEIVGSITVTGIPFTTVTGAHIHQAPFGQNGAVKFNLLTNQVPGSPIVFGNNFAVVFNGLLPGTAAERQSVLAAWLNDDGYINVHTAQFPGGEIRGQIHCTGVVPEPASIAALALGGLGLVIRRKRR